MDILLPSVLLLILNTVSKIELQIIKNNLVDFYKIIGNSNLQLENMLVERLQFTFWVCSRIAYWGFLDPLH